MVCANFWVRVYLCTREECTPGSGSPASAAEDSAPAVVTFTVDIVTGLPPSSGHSVMLTIVDRFLKCVHYLPLSKLPSAADPVQPIGSDRGPHFTSRVQRSFCASFGVTAILSYDYHPQSNGQTEQENQTLDSALQCVAACNNATWSSYLLWAEYIHNSLVSASTGMSPYMVSTGHQPPLFKFEEDMAQFVCAGKPTPLQSSLVRNSRCASASLCPGTETSKPPTSTRPHIPGGPEVMASIKTPSFTGRGKKLAPRFVRPFEVVKMVNPVAVRLRLPPSLSASHLPWLPSQAGHRLDLGSIGHSPSSPRMLADGLVHMVRRILDVH